MKLKELIAVIGLSSLAALANADVIVDPTTGKGFVGKGDVQAAFSWNNATLQANANNLSFQYRVLETYVGTCTWYTIINTQKVKKTIQHTVQREREVEVVNAIAYSPRIANQINGFNLNGFTGGTKEVGGQAPVVGGACPADDADEESSAIDAVWELVTKTSTGMTLTVTDKATNRSVSLL